MLCVTFMLISKTSSKFDQKLVILDVKIGPGTPPGGSKMVISWSFLTKFDLHQNPNNFLGSFLGLLDFLGVHFFS